MNTHKHTNLLINETSPYLLQHAHNPVDWRPWNEEALDTAKRQDKPILLSIGYSACHWCHVMEHESFENEEIAAIMNEFYVSIKVDREERPDLDQIYQSVVQMLTGSGGWPLTMFLTPDQQPFYAGTYFPPEDRYGRPGFPRLLIAIAAQYRDKRGEIDKSLAQIDAALKQHSAPEAAGGELNAEALDNAANHLARLFDNVEGGFGSQPKFPNPMNLEFFLRTYKRTGKQSFLDMALLALQKMAHGGIYDQLGGGFHRYSVDAHWLAPHFEKMLYDNALLIKLYADAYQLTRNLELRRIAVDAIDYVCREMIDPAGGFYSTQDADSEGVEGKFFVWTPEQVAELLDEEEQTLFNRFYDVTPGGNFEHGNTILHRTITFEQLGKLHHTSAEAAEATVRRAAKKLFEHRCTRVRPFRDEKVLTAWNGLMIAAFVRAAVVLEEQRYLDVALRAIEFIRTTMLRDGLLLRTYKDGQSRLNAYLDDYAFLVHAVLDAFEATGSAELFELASSLHQTMIAQFHDADGGGFFFTGKDHERLIIRSKSAYDHAIPSGNSVAVQNLLRFYFLTGDERQRRMAEEAMRLYVENMQENPFSFGNMLCALDYYVDTPKEIVIVGARSDAAVQAMLAAVHGVYLPNKILHRIEAAELGAASLPAALEGKGQVDGKPTAYVCHNLSCSVPVYSAEALAELLA